MPNLTYYCCAPNCTAEGTDIAAGRMFCKDHYRQLRKCDCSEDWQYLLPGEGCEKCGANLLERKPDNG